ncbi:hydrogenase expression/formation protein HypE [Syntrophothermus lipocalidus]|uniref:Hydrogenase expression/formation protein HypE n=1 Tax=Syntrophothermus lipocalidus (strain DSM 12680 / TGB-C1) TaxID=643648 RepID=D7CKE1_SYNLT|nr:hydrogenase expression/formation protein HypE [Syntrophothermus lipocalidus]ADI01176.1 hydrogenase expression/formation protein HypE [Syntrophothermus lipocalidus DSM 12680]
MRTRKILLGHGSGGRMTQELVNSVFKKTWANPYLDQMLDGAILEVGSQRIAMTTDSFVITPLFFPGGDIGKLSVYGTVNDLVACGARPLYVSAGLIIEEGFGVEELEKIAASMSKAALEAGVQLVTGDTKVVEKGKADGIFINTTGIGIIRTEVDYRPDRIKPGDAVIVTGKVGEHGLAVLAQREGLSFSTPVTSDCQPLHRVGELLARYGQEVRCMRDPTRGGVATVLNELAQQSGTGFIVREEDIPLDPVVQGACEMLGLDALYLANEGKMVVVVAKDAAQAIVEDLRQLPESRDSAVIGYVKDEVPGLVLLETELGAHRILNMLESDQLPRIC